MCENYLPGPIPGKERAVCQHYVMEPKEASGGCKLPNHFMCEFWLARLGKQATAPRSAMEKKILDTFPGSKVVERRAAA